MDRTTLTNFLNAYQELISFPTVEDAVKQYQKQPNDIILTYIYTQLYKSVLFLGRQYPLVPEDDQISLAFTELTKAISLYDASLHIKFITYYLTFIKRLFGAYTKSMYYNKNMANLHSLRETGTFVIDNHLKTSHLEAQFNTIELLESLPEDLTRIEKAYCELVLKCPQMNKLDISLALDCSPSTITYINKRLQIKLQHFL